MRAAVLVSLAVLITSCAPSGPAPIASDRSSGTLAREHVLTASIETEPNFIAALAPAAGLAATDFWQRFFNAFLDLYDGDDHPQPYLAEALPALNTDSWIVFPDGKMETRYHLKPNLVWHDGAPLTADDFVFTFQNATAAVGFRTANIPFTLIESVTATDDRSLVIRWKNLYPDANVLLQGATRFGLVPLPRHILQSTFEGAVAQTIQESPYWAREFVGAGPFKLDHWELGSFLEATAFEQHALGRPKIDRIRLLFVTDQNTAFANILAGSTDVALNSISFQHEVQLKKEWAASQKGTAGLNTVSLTTAQFQFRPDYANPRAVLDVRVRRAFAQAFDKQTFSDVAWAGELAVIDSIFDPRTSFYPTIERAITKYPLDLAATERLMNEAGYRKGPDGFYAGPGGKLTFVLQSGPFRQELPVLAGNWRHAGFDIQEHELSRAESVDSQVRSTFTALSVNTSGAFEVQQTSLYRASEVTSADNRWRGENRTGWANLDYDGLVDAFNVTLDQNQRIQQRAQMAKLLTEDLPAIVLAPNPNMHAYLNTVKNVGNTTMFTTGRITWNIEKWEVQ